jgi:uncharacterized membrane protein
MKRQAICQLLFINAVLLPGELGVMTLVMFAERSLSLLPWLCGVGIILTLNVFITAQFAQHVRERRERKEQEERIENS